VTPGAARACPALLLAGTYVVALGGRFTLDRIGLTRYEFLDLAVLGGAVVLTALLVWWLDPRWTSARPRPQGTVVLVLVLVGYLALTAFWAPPGARVGENVALLCVLAVLVVTVAALLGPDPEAGRRILLWTVLTSGVLYALAGLIIGDTDVQGRTTAFGGGANVFGRVVCLGIIAAVALAVIHRRRVLLLAVPLLGVAAVLSGSKGAFVSLAVALVVFVLVFGNRISVRVAGPLVAVAVAGAAAAVALLGSQLTTILDERFLQVAEGGSDFSGRPGLLTGAWRIFGESPVVGAGLDSFRALFGWTQDLDYPHNVVAELATTGGVVALALFAAFLVGWLRAWGPPRELSSSQVALVLAALFVLTSSLFSGDLYDTRFFWIFAVAATAAARTWYPRHRGPAVPRTTPTTPTVHAELTR
jgi:O-antigen ligase